MPINPEAKGSRLRYWGPEGAPKTPESKLAKFGQRTLPGRVFKPALAPETLAEVAPAAPVPAPASLAELARALRYDVDLIYEWVYTNVDFYCLWGCYKGSLGTIIDELATPFDQAALMVELLRASGYTANFVKGNIHLTRAQIENWLGTTESTQAAPSETLLFTANIPNLVFDYDMDGLLNWVEMDHVWVQVDIGGTNYVFDPSFKTYDYTNGVDIATATGWIDEDDESYDALRTDAMVGATEGMTYGDITDINRTNIINDFTEYGTALLAWIRSNKFDSSLIEITGGRAIEAPGSTPVRQTSLDYQTSGSPITIWADIPDEFKRNLSMTMRHFFV